ncbi:MAG: mitochondrial fission ELM1 family protein [Verrucomicrobia bacterium]|nr:mitochondrial fission ELM1 family protein [Verrucomicrobiota bacterium]
MKALILTDGKPGHENQSIALCRHLGMDFEKVIVSYPWKPAKALSYLLDHLGIYSQKLFTCHLPPVTCQLIISTGSTTFYPNKVLARKLGLPNIAILNPKGYRPDFTQILCPAYDHPPKRANIVELPLNLCAADKSFFVEKAEEFKTRHLAKVPAVGFIIGGPNAVSTIDAVALKKQLEKAFVLTEGCERWVTTSRRTPADVEAVIEALPFDYRLINSRDSYNPVPAFIHLCDRLFVTSDSASMISECASFGTASVEILMNRQIKTPNKFEELIQGLENLNAVHLFDGTLGDANRKIDLKEQLQEVLKCI